MTPKYTKAAGNRVINPEYAALWKPYLEEGMAAKHVAEMFRVSKMTVLKYYPGYRWTPKQVLEHSMDVKRLNKLSKTL